MVAQTIAALATGKGKPGAFDGHGERFIEVGGGKAALSRRNFYAEPAPTLKFYKPNRY